jgi:hypothetical protein
MAFIAIRMIMACRITIAVHKRFVRGKPETISMRTGDTAYAAVAIIAKRLFMTTGVGTTAINRSTMHCRPTLSDMRLRSCIRVPMAIIAKNFGMTTIGAAFSDKSLVRRGPSGNSM